MRRRAFFLLIGLLVLFMLGALTPDAEAVQVKRVQRGIANFDTDDVAALASLTYSVDQTKSIILLNVSGDSVSNNDQNWFYTADFADNTSISIDRAGGNSPSSVVWQVIEFADGVTIQRGITVVNGTNNSAGKQKSITLAALSTTTASGTACGTAQGYPYNNFPCRALPIIQVRASYTNATRTDEVVFLPSFTNNTTLFLERSDSGSGKVSSIV